MAVLVEATSVIVRTQAIQNRYPGGWSSFVADAPNSTFCSDNELVRIGFMAPDDCQTFIKGLERRGGLVFLKNKQSQDIVVADQMRGFTVSCEWAEFGRTKIRAGQSVSAARLKGSKIKQVLCPEGWTFEGSLSQQFGFAPTGTVPKSLKYLRHEQGLDVYLNLLTGKEVYVGRSGWNRKKAR